MAAPRVEWRGSPLHGLGAHVVHRRERPPRAAADGRHLRHRSGVDNLRFPGRADAAASASERRTGELLTADGLEPHRDSAGGARAPRGDRGAARDPAGAQAIVRHHHHARADGHDRTAPPRHASRDLRSKGPRPLVPRSRERLRLRSGRRRSQRHGHSVLDARHMGREVHRRQQSSTLHQIEKRHVESGGRAEKEARNAAAAPAATEKQPASAHTQDRQPLKGIVSMNYRNTLAALSALLAFPLAAQSNAPLLEQSDNVLLRGAGIALAVVMIWFVLYKGVYPFFLRYYRDEFCKTIFWNLFFLYTLTWILVSFYVVLDVGFYWALLLRVAVFLGLWCLISDAVLLLRRVPA